MCIVKVTKTTGSLERTRVHSKRLARRSWAARDSSERPGKSPSVLIVGLFERVRGRSVVLTPYHLSSSPLPASPVPTLEVHMASKLTGGVPKRFFSSRELSNGAPDARGGWGSRKRPRILHFLRTPRVVLLQPHDHCPSRPSSSRRDCKYTFVINKFRGRNGFLLSGTLQRQKKK